jgi:drug/metabolite transporter (DMT)-like permease
MRADLVLVAVNLVYATAFVATRLTLGDVPPALLALARCVLGGALLLPLTLRGAHSIGSRDHVRLVWMGVLGFGVAFALTHWGLLKTTAANAALLIVIEPVAIIAMSPALLGERLRRREAVGSAVAIVGTVIVVLNGIPGLTEDVVPRWRGDVLLVLSGLAYAAYSLIGRSVLRRHPATCVTGLSISWGAVALAPLAALEWSAGMRPTWTGPALLGIAYLAVVITAFGYLAWNWCLQRVPAPRAAIFLNVQPVAGTLLGVVLLDDPFTLFTALGGVLVVAGLSLTVRRAREDEPPLRASPSPRGG